MSSANNLNLNEAIRCLTIIKNSNLCLICDKLEGDRVRFQCGHISCEKCVNEFSECNLCTSETPQLSPKLDTVSTHRAENASKLCRYFETLFSVNINTRLRLSEQLKIEKEVFPECIQAPTKYTNKAKTTNLSLKSRKSLQSFFLGGEDTAHKAFKMHKSSYIEQWLEQNEKLSFDSLPRIPLGSLNVNSPRVKSRTPLSLRKGKIKTIDLEQEDNKKTSKSKKRKSIPDFLTENSYSDSFSLKRIKHDNGLPKKTNQNENIVNNIELNSLPEPILIEDSQSEGAVDKDREALLAVIRAEEQASAQTAKESCEIASEQLVQKHKVPFYKKGLLRETCKHCVIKMSENGSAEQTRSVSITIENNSFSTIIHVFNAHESNLKISKQLSVDIQTDVSCNNQIEEYSMREKSELDLNTVNHIFSKQSLRKNSKNNSENANALTKANKPVVIADSDSDDNTDQSYTLQVRADVHSNCDQVLNGVLTELDPHNLLPRRGNVNRALTPCSSNSSEKENFDPNKSKKTKSTKKKK